MDEEDWIAFLVGLTLIALGCVLMVLGFVL